MILRPTSLDEAARAAAAQPKLAVRGAGTKPALHAEAPAVMDLSALRGIVEYEPSEFTITALAGTPVAEVQSALAEHEQHLPFDPPLAAAGATLGGTVAAGLSGSGRWKHGGLRDFLIGVRFVDGRGRLIRGGGKVVKNAAGFDLPKFLIGGLDCFGPMLELTFKVFPAPRAFRTLHFECRDLRDALARMNVLASRPLDLQALDVEPPGTLWVRLSGDPDALAASEQAVASVADRPHETAADPQEASHWEAANAFDWAPAASALVKIPLTAHRIPALDACLEAWDAPRRYAVAGNLAWASLDADHLEAMDRTLKEQGLGALVLRGATGRRRLGADPARPFAQRIKRALDPQNRYPDL